MFKHQVVINFSKFDLFSTMKTNLKNKYKFVFWNIYLSIIYTSNTKFILNI